MVQRLEAKVANARETPLPLMRAGSSFGQIGPRHFGCMARLLWLQEIRALEITTAIIRHPHPSKKYCALLDTIGLASFLTTHVHCAAKQYHQAKPIHAVWYSAQHQAAKRGRGRPKRTPKSQNTSYVIPGGARIAGCSRCSPPNTKQPPTPDQPQARARGTSRGS